MTTPRVIARSEWTDRPNTAPQVDDPYNEVVIHTEAGAVRDEDWPAITEAARTLSLTERQHMAAIDAYHRNVRGWANGFGYNFLIEPDGTIIEGRGWGRVGGHTQAGRNYTAVAICFAGHGDIEAATEAQWLSARWLIGEGIRLGELVANPPVNGHRDYAQKSCPGTKIYPFIGRLRGIHGPGTPTTVSERTDFMASLTEKEQRQLYDWTRESHLRAAELQKTVVGTTVDGKNRHDRVIDLLHKIDKSLQAVLKHFKITV